MTLEGSISGNWYDSYVSYALKNGILDAVPEDCDSVIDRTGFVAIFYRALPERAYTKLNQIADGAIPDVNPDDANAAEIYAFYRAGILTGYTGDAAYAEHAFGGSSQISRAEVAAILNRMTDETARVTFTLG
ncbi:MAG: S-layer homology domain-containing protein [Oscillospiraceae bacterium]|nr:S-layer homology domain-containing protein [Oscillospiraceae bacterium]